MEIDLIDWTGLPATIPVTLTITHEPWSAGVCSIGVPTNLGGNRWAVPLRVGPGSGLDAFRVEIAGGLCPAILMPSPTECLGDPCACDPSIGAPALATNLRVSGSGRIAWTAPARAYRHAIHSGAIGELHADRGTTRSSCLVGDRVLPDHDDARPPLPRDGWYYLAQGRNACGDGGVGMDSLGRPRVVTACP